jgi:hypothetical protein
MEWMYSPTHSLASALDGGEWSTSRAGRFTPRERTPGTHWIGGWVGPSAVLDAVVKRKIPSPRRESNPRTPIVQTSSNFLYCNYHIHRLMKTLKWPKGLFGIHQRSSFWSGPKSPFKKLRVYCLYGWLVRLPQHRIWNRSPHIYTKLVDRRHATSKGAVVLTC